MFNDERNFESELNQTQTFFTHKCPNCGKAYAHRQSLHVHTKRCIDGRKFACLICRPIKTFSTQSSVLGHLKTHPNVPSYNQRRFYRECKVLEGKSVQGDDGPLVPEDSFGGIDVPVPVMISKWPNQTTSISPSPVKGGSPFNLFVILVLSNG